MHYVCDWGYLFSFSFLFYFFRFAFCFPGGFMLLLLLLSSFHFGSFWFEWEMNFHLSAINVWWCFTIHHWIQVGWSVIKRESERTMTWFHCKMNRKTWTHQLNQCHYRRIRLDFSASFIHHGNESVSAWTFGAISLDSFKCFEIERIL